MNAASDLLQKLYNTVFGMPPNTAPTAPTAPARTEPNGVPAWAQATSKPALVTAERGVRLLQCNEVVTEGFKQALEDFATAKVAPYARYTKTFFRVDEIHTYVTADNKAILSDLQSMDRDIRNDIGKNCISQVSCADNLLKTGNGFKWQILTAPDATNDDRRIYSVLAGNGPEQVALSFVFCGDYIAVKPDKLDDQKEKAHTAARLVIPASADDMATLEITPLAQPVLRVRVTEAGQPARQIEVTNLPLVIGRGSACDVIMVSPILSRKHATISFQSHGQLVLENHSVKGTQLTTQSGQKKIDVGVGQQLVLPLEGRITLGEAAGAGAAHLDFETCQSTADTQATFEISPPAPSQAPLSTMLQTPEVTAPDDLPIQDLTYLMEPRDQSDSVPATFCFADDKASAQKAAKAKAPGALARIWVRNGDGAVTSEFIYELPFIVGREPEQANGIKVIDPSASSSRRHLEIKKIKGSSAFYTHNMAWRPDNLGGTWVKTAAGTEPLGEYFHWELGTRGGPDGWLELGRNPDLSQVVNSMGVQVRLERVL